MSRFRSRPSCHFVFGFLSERCSSYLLFFSRFSSSSVPGNFLFSGLPGTVFLFRKGNYTGQPSTMKYLKNNDFLSVWEKLFGLVNHLGSPDQMSCKKMSASRKITEPF
jgi:hypothetical protein